ncbi:hypothetical protein QF022_001474 [Vogesella perlucida]|nr:hypothetical protein [Vogesella perlucida]
MSEITAGELWAREEELESSAASLLGRMLFEFSRLDVNLGLCLVWVDGGARIDSLTQTVEALTLKYKLDELDKRVTSTYPEGSKGHRGYKAWTERAHLVRQQRNNLVHGRWGVEAAKNKVVNVIGLPTSNSQQTTEYSIEELAEINNELQELQRELARLRKHWPL